MAGGIFPDRGLDWCPLHCKADSLPLDHQGRPSGHLFFQLWVYHLICSFLDRKKRLIFYRKGTWWNESKRRITCSIVRGLKLNFWCLWWYFRVLKEVFVCLTKWGGGLTLESFHDILKFLWKSTTELYLEPKSCDSWFWEFSTRS